MRWRRIARWIFLSLAGLVLALAGLVWFGPVTIGDKGMLLDMVLGRGIAPPNVAEAKARLVVPAGFRLEVYSTQVSNARWLLATQAGDLVVAQSSNDRVVLLERDVNGEGKPDGVRTLVDSLPRPHGLAVHDGWLYIGYLDGVARTRFDVTSGRTSGRVERIVNDFTSNGAHRTKTVGFDADGWLYVSQGSTCNVCIENDPRRAAIMRMRPDGTQRELYATGLRNSVGFDWAPWDQALYATENGRDLLGDDSPPEELNRIERGKFYGWPFVHGFGIEDPEFATGHDQDIARAVPPVHGFRAHNAPLGIVFLRGSNLPAGYERTALVALHGSWNRSIPDGYKVVALDWKPDGNIVERDFVTGFIGPGGVLGRPASVAQGPDGAIYVADDYRGVIYRIVHD
jgi:glucose/arabinose dehydrogenase